MARRGRPATIIREWLTDEYAKKWLNSLGERTQKSAIKQFHHFQQFVDLTPTEMIQKRMKDLQSNNPQIRSYFETKVIEFLDSFEANKYTPMTLMTKVSRIMSFFSFHRVRLQFRRGEVQRVVQKNREGRVVQKWLLTNEEARLVYGVSDTRNRGLFLLLYQSGFSEIDVSEFNIEDIPQLYTNYEGHVNIAKERSKTHILQKTCISTECLHDLRMMLMERGKPQTGALFISESGGEKGQTTRKRLTTRYINESIKALVAKTFGKEEAKKFKTKNLRDCYNDALLRANIPQQLRDTMFGHKASGARSHYQVSDITIKENYTKAFQYLSVNHGTQSRKSVEELKSVVLGLSATVTEQQKQIEAQQQSLTKIERLMMFSLEKHRFINREALDQAIKEIQETQKPLKQILKKYAIPETEQTE